MEGFRSREDAKEIHMGVAQACSIPQLAVEFQVVKFDRLVIWHFSPHKTIKMCGGEQFNW